MNFLLFLAIFYLTFVDTSANLKSRDAYVTMLYTIHGEMYVEGFEIGVRVLGQSLRESKTTYDYVVLCTDDVPQKVKDVLKKDGWIVKTLNKLPLTPRFNENIFKLNIWQLKEYRRIVFIDADAIVVRNVDELFRCGAFCATFRHSDLFNSGVMVVEPSVPDLNQMLKAMNNISGTWFHKTFGDQMVLNFHFKDLKKATMFDPTLDEYQSKPMRLATGYNADVGVYYLSNGWTISSKDLKIIHYTMGIVKPMIWWTYPLFDLNWKWDDLRGRLPSRFHEPSAFAFKHWLPSIILTMLFLSFRLCSNSYKYVYRQRVFGKLNVLLVPGPCGWCVVVFPIITQTVSILFSMYCVPAIMRPKVAWLLCTFWITFFMILFYSLYCRYLYEMGESYGSRFITVQAARVETVIHGSLFVVLYLLMFYFPYMISSFHTRVICFVGMFCLNYVQGYVSGRRVLKIWYGHNTKTVSVLPCYRLESPVVHSQKYVDKIVHMCCMYCQIWA